MVDREPQPEDGPDYHADHKYWEARQCDCAGPMTQTRHANNAEGHQVTCPRWGIPWDGGWGSD